jgi:RecJ-like exonuclease
MTVEMQRMLHRLLVHDIMTPDRSPAYQISVQVVHNHFDDLAILEHVWIDVSVDYWVRHFSLVDGERCVESGYLGTNICMSVQGIS